MWSSGADLVVPGGQFEPTLALDVPLEDPRIGDQTFVGQTLGDRRQVVILVDRETLHIPGSAFGVDLAEVPPTDRAGDQDRDDGDHHREPDDPLERAVVASQSFDRAGPVRGIPRIGRPVDRRTTVGVDLRLGEQRVELLHRRSAVRVSRRQVYRPRWPGGGRATPAA